MAITVATKTSDFSGFLTREQSAAIFAQAAQQSVVQQLARQVPLGINGQSIPVVTGKVTAGWVAEGAAKPASSGSMSLKTMDPKKLAAIAVVSAEVVRANPGGYMDQLRPQIGEAFGIAFDAAALHGTSSPFSTNLDTGSSTQEFTGTTPAFTAVYDDLNAGFATLVNAGKKVTGWAFDSRMEPVFNGAKDTAGRPLWIDSPTVDQNGPFREGRLFGRPAFTGDGIYAATPKIYGYAGDWSQVAWGAVGGISYKVSTEATVTINGTLVSLFENNLVAILAEAEYGFLVNDPSSFVKFTNAELRQVVAIKKPVTTSDLTAAGDEAPPTRDEMVAAIVEATSPEMVAKVDTPQYVKVKAPFSGAVSEVPAGIVDALLDSGYTKSK